MGKIEKFNVSGKFDITIHEEYDKNTIYEYMKKSKVLLNTSIYDGFPYVIAEALANGLPIVAYSQPELELFAEESGVIQFNTDWNGAYWLLRLILSDKERKDKSIKAKKFMNGLYLGKDIERRWKNILETHIFNTDYFRKYESQLFKMMIRNI